MNCNIQKKKGKILGQFTLNAYSDEPELPDISPDDAGKFLGINTQGEIEAKTIPTPEGKKYYQHNISIKHTLQGNLYFSFISSDATEISTMAQFNYAMTSMGFSTSYIPVSSTVSKIGTANSIRFLTGVRKGDSYSPGFRFIVATYALTDGVLTTTLTSETVSWDSSTHISDKVVEL